MVPPAPHSLCRQASNQIHSHPITGVLYQYEMEWDEACQRKIPDEAVSLSVAEILSFIPSSTKPRGAAVCKHPDFDLSQNRGILGYQ